MTKLNLCTINQITSYSEYLSTFEKKAKVDNVNNLSEYDKKYFEYIKLNFQRSIRVEKTFEPMPETLELFYNIERPQQWFVITESWCGDSAQILPVIAKLAKLSEKINLQIILRDTNLDFMELYLTNGSRSIPKLVVFDETGNELFQWGPRPQEAQNLFSGLKEQGMEKPEIIKELHLWYAKNKGREIENEICELLKSTVEVSKNN